MIVVICLLVIPTVCSIIVLVASLSEVLALSLWRTVGTIVIALPLIGLLSSLAIVFLQLL
jgi:hypothetical protein